MARFKVGDRVRVTGSGEKSFGMIGRVVEEHRCPWVLFDSPTDIGGKVQSPEGVTEWKLGHMDCVYEGSLTAWKPYTLDEAIAQYQSACERFEKAQADVAEAKAAIQRALES